MRFKGLFPFEGVRSWNLLKQRAKRGDQVLFLRRRDFADRYEIGDEIMAALEDVARVAPALPRRLRDGH